MSRTDLIPKCPECETPLDPVQAGCQCSEGRFHRDDLGLTRLGCRRFAYLEAQVAVLLEREEERLKRGRPRSARTAQD